MQILREVCIKHIIKRLYVRKINTETGSDSGFRFSDEAVKVLLSILFFSLLDITLCLEGGGGRYN